MAMEEAVINNIKNNYADISTAEKKVADYILSNTLKVGEMNVSELARSSGVSDATVVRLCKHLGYKGYHQFMIFLARDIGDVSQEKKEHESLFSQKDPASIIFATYAKYMEQIAENVSTEILMKSAGAVRNAEFVHIIAIGNTNPLTQYMQFRLERVGIRCTGELSQERFLNQVNLASNKDALIAISQSGSSKIVVSTAQLAKDKGLKVIAITANRESPLSRIADFVLCSASHFDSLSYYRNYAHLKETAIVDAFIEFVTNWDKINNTGAFTPELMSADTKY